MIQLTGPPTLNGWTAPYPSINRHMQVDWVDESRYKELGGGTKKLIERRLRGRIRCGWEALDLSVAQTLLSYLGSDTVTVVPRTQAAGETEAEQSYDCRVVSDLPSTDAISSGTFSMEVELETLTVYSQQPGV